MKVLRLASVMAMILVPLAAAAKDTVTGKLTAKGQATSLNYVYAFRKAPWNAPQKPNLHVLLADKEVPAAAIPKDDAGVSKMAELVRSGAIHAIELRFAGDDTSKLDAGEQGAIYHVAIAPARQGVSGPLKLEAVKGGPNTVAGKVSFDPASVEALGWSCEATFEVELPAK